MSEPRLFRLRATYVEQGRLAMLSHLEVARALERTVRRADLPFAVTQGFSPHMKLAFGSALPVGVGSTCEIFDVWLTRYVAPAKVLAALQAASTPDLMVQECAYIEPSAPAASVAFPYSTYEVRFSRAPEAGELVVPERIVRVRKKKGKTVEKAMVVADYLVGDVQLSGDVTTFTLKSSQEGALRPDMLLAESLAGAANDLRVESITRVAQE